MAALKDFEVFISYRHKDNDKAHRLHDMLQTQYDIFCFRDEEELHFGDFRRQLIRSNRRSKYLVLLVTEHTFGRCGEEGDWITKEIELFLKRRKPIIPVLIGGATIPDNLPERIQGVRRYLPNAIVCPHTDATAMGRFVSAELCKRLRPNWDEQMLAESPSQRWYLSRENVGEKGYFYTTAMTFRRYVALMLYFVLLVLTMMVSPNVPVAVVFIVHTLFAEHRRVDDEQMIMADVVLDRSIFQSFVILFKPLLVTLLISVACTYGAFFAVSTAFRGFGLVADASTAETITADLLPTIVSAVLGVRLLSKLVFSALHFGNCLLGRYPASLYRYWALGRWERGMRIAGWILLAPAVIGGGYLLLTSMGVL